MIDQTPNADRPVAVRIPARNQRQAMDWSLVLASQSIPTRLEGDDAETYWLEVSETDAAKAREVLSLFQSENRRWRWQRRIPTTPLVFHWGSLIWVAVILSLHAVTTRNPALHDAGIMQAASVRNGEWWRPITAVTLHADTAHLTANAMSGFLFLGSRRRFRCRLGLRCRDDESVGHVGMRGGSGGLYDLCGEIIEIPKPECLRIALQGRGGWCGDFAHAL